MTQSLEYWQEQCEDLRGLVEDLRSEIARRKDSERELANVAAQYKTRCERLEEEVRAYYMAQKFCIQ